MRKSSESRGQINREEISRGLEEPTFETLEKMGSVVSNLILEGLNGDSIRQYDSKERIRRIRDYAARSGLDSHELQVVVASVLADAQGDFAYNNQWVDILRYYIKSFNLSSSDPEVRQHMMRLLEASFYVDQEGWDDEYDLLWSYRELESLLGLTVAENERLYSRGILKRLSEGRAEGVVGLFWDKEKGIFKDAEPIPPEVLRQAVLDGLYINATTGSAGMRGMEVALSVLSEKDREMCLRDEALQAKVRQSLEEALDRDDLDFHYYSKLQKMFQIPPEVFGIAAIYFDKSVPKEIREARETYRKHSGHGFLLDDSGPSSEDEGAILPIHQRARLTHGMSPREYMRALSTDPGLERSERPLEDAYDALLVQLRARGGESVQIAKYMELIGQLFGKEGAMRFANRPDLSRHDAFGSAKDLKMFALTQGFNIEDPMTGKENPEEINRLKKTFGPVLDQIAQDRVVDSEGRNSYIRFDYMLASMKHIALDEMLEGMESSEIEALAVRARELRSGKQSYLQSWKGLKGVWELYRLANNAEMMESLKNAEASESVKRYVAHLLRYPEIDLEALHAFLNRPAEFLNREARFVAEERQSALSPICMARVERLGLQPEKIRDALVDGTMDKLQILPPEEQNYLFDDEGREINTVAYLQSAFGRAIGRQREGIKGLAQDPKLLFDDLVRWARKYAVEKVTVISWLRGEVTLAVDDQGRHELTQILHSPGRGVPEPEGMHVRVRIGRKSDPDMIVAGNDTASCMPFGDGKTNVYSWNPNCAQMVVERRNTEGEWRTMAQSVVMLDIDVGKPSGQVLNSLTRGQRIDTVISAEVFAGLPKVICDNIEPAPSDIAAGRGAIIENAYEQFFKSYLHRHADELGVDPSEVLIGKESYEINRPEWRFKKKVNTFLPLAPVSYSDSLGGEVYSIPLDIVKGTAKKSERSSVAPVTAADILPMAFLEGKGFADNENLVFGLYDRQHKIVGASIAREQHGDPNLCLITRDSAGIPVGYIIAYVDRSSPTPEVFIDDMAVDRSRNVLAARHASIILDEFLSTYVRHYSTGEAGFPPIFAQARESTSYRLLTRQMKTLSERYGLHAEMVEEGSTTMGGEVFKLIRIFVGKTEEELRVAKERRPRVSGFGGGREGWLDENGRW